MGARKTKLTITVDAEILTRAKDTVKGRHLSLSGVIERFLDFFSDPYVYCFKCGEKFRIRSAEICPKCGWLKCPQCDACRCSLGEEAAIAVFHMRRVLEELMGGRLKW
ncbi:MAG: DUF6364 family protein [Candidatus Baldrarchaeia archaeon]